MWLPYRIVQSFQKPGLQRWLLGVQHLEERVEWTPFTILDSAELSGARPSMLTSGCPASRRNGRVGPIPLIDGAPLKDEPLKLVCVLLLCPPGPQQMRSAVNDRMKLKANEMPSVRVANSFQKSGEQATLAIYQTLVTTWAWSFNLVIIICFNMYKKIIIRS